MIATATASTTTTEQPTSITMITTTSTETVSTAKLTLTIYITIGIVGSGLYEYVLIKCFLSNLFTNFLDDEFLIIPGISFHDLNLRFFYYVAESSFFNC